MSLLKNIIKKAAGYKEFEFKVAGVTFKNGKQSRQRLIRSIKYGDPPFNNGVEITIDRYDYEGQVAIAVYANGEQLGSVPAKLVPEIDKAWKKRYLIEHYEVLGSGNTAPFGFRVKILFE